MDCVLQTMESLIKKLRAQVEQLRQDGCTVGRDRGFRMSTLITSGAQKDEEIKKLHLEVAKCHLREVALFIPCWCCEY